MEHLVHRLDDEQFTTLVRLLTDSRNDRLDKLLASLQTLTAQGAKLMATLDEVLADVAEESTRIDSLSTLVAGIKKQLDDILKGALPPDVQAKVDAVFAGVEANKTKVQSAIDANTTPTP